MKKEKYGIILPITLFSYFLILMDNSIIFTSSLQIGESFRFSPTELSWVSSAYTLSFGGFLLLSGRLLDMFGRRKVFLIGLFIFGISSLIIGCTQSGSLLILMRGIQGIGSSIIAPATLALIMDYYQGEQRARAIAYYGATAGIGASIGLILGGGLTTFISWRAGFIINVPFVLVLGIATYRNIHSSGTHQQKLDIVGSILSILGLAALIYGLSEGSWLIMGLGVGLLTIFLYFESKTKQPILPLSLFQNRIRASAYLVRLLFMMAMLPLWFYLPQMMQSTYHFTALQSALAFLPLTIVNFVIAMLLPKISRYFQNTWILFIGEIVLFIGEFWLVIVDVDRGYIHALLLPMILLGIGQGLVLSPVTSAGVYQAPQHLAGIASALTNTMHQIGGPLGLSIIVLNASQFNTKMMFITSYTAIAIIIIVFGMLRKKNK
ncbi:MFS transporter [Enterococcus cecorum]|uniref:MFS transporter n=1 Tax=Enterococcus cecorum TaxID=44008 RepID=UPI00148C5E18|nr:MFS transporter [Enterococcus cecorum]